jgi:hypothetical protein
VPITPPNTCREGQPHERQFCLTADGFIVKALLMAWDDQHHTHAPGG